MSDLADLERRADAHLKEHFPEAYERRERNRAMAKAETIFGWEVERINDRRVRITNGDREITMKGGPDLEGDALVKAAIDQAEAVPTVPPEGSHVVDVPVGTMGGTGKAT